jgi:hypothetical protein
MENIFSSLKQKYTADWNKNSEMCGWSRILCERGNFQFLPLIERKSREKCTYM